MLELSNISRRCSILQALVDGEDDNEIEDEEEDEQSNAKKKV
jgi:hypothetical protein